MCATTKTKARFLAPPQRIPLARTHAEGKKADQDEFTRCRTCKTKSRKWSNRKKITSGPPVHCSSRAYVFRHVAFQGTMPWLSIVGTRRATANRTADFYVFADKRVRFADGFVLAVGLSPPPQ